MKLVVLYSFILAILHSILFYGQKWGISVFLFILAGLFLFEQMLEKNGKLKNPRALIIAAPIVILSTTYFLFSSTLFNALNVIVILALFFVMTVTAVLGKFQPYKILENLSALIFGPLEEIPDSIKEVKKCLKKDSDDTQTTIEKGKGKMSKKILKGVLISSPIVVLVLALLSTADEMFGAIFEDIFRWILDILNIDSVMNVIFRAIIIFILTIIFIGVMLTIKKDRLKVVGEEKTFDKKLKIEGVTLATLLTLLNIVYLLFSGIQIIHLFERNISNYADFARAGFFQLMVVSFINFVVILITKLNKKEMSESLQKYIKVMNIFLAIFTVVILITSVVRMIIYEGAYGYTYLRLLVNFIQVTELILIIPTILYIVKDNFKIVKWYTIIILCMYIILNFTNLDFIIAKGNIDRYFNNNQNKEKIDFSYLEKHTSTGALTQITRLLETNDKDLKTIVNNYLYAEYQELASEKETWQNFNLTKIIAKDTLAELNLSFKEIDYKFNSIYY